MNGVSNIQELNQGNSKEYLILTGNLWYMSKTTRNQSEIKKQISDLILSDDSLLKSIVEAVSSVIIENMCENESFAQNKQTKDKIKQDLYQSLSFDQDQLQDKHTALQNSYEQLKKSCDNLREPYDTLEQY